MAVLSPPRSGPVLPVVLPAGAGIGATPQWRGRRTTRLLEPLRVLAGGHQELGRGDGAAAAGLEYRGAVLAYDALDLP